jgi:hypothetical protein
MFKILFDPLFTAHVPACRTARLDKQKRESIPLQETRFNCDPQVLLLLHEPCKLEPSAR